MTLLDLRQITDAAWRIVDETNNRRDCYQLSVTASLDSGGPEKLSDGATYSIFYRHISRPHSNAYALVEDMYEAHNALVTFRQQLTSRQMPVDE